MVTRKFNITDATCFIFLLGSTGSELERVRYLNKIVVLSEEGSLLFEIINASFFFAGI